MSSPYREGEGPCECRYPDCERCNPPPPPVWVDFMGLLMGNATHGFRVEWWKVMA